MPGLPTEATRFRPNSYDNRFNPVIRVPGSIGAATIRGTGRKHRTITLNWKACTPINVYLTVPPVDVEDDRLFVTKFRRGMGPRAIQRVVEKYLTEASIVDASVQSLRHTFATHRIRRRESPEVVRHALGHESLATTANYISVADDKTTTDVQEQGL